MPQRASLPSSPLPTRNSPQTSLLQRYRALFNLAPDAYIATDLEGRIEAANDAAAALLERGAPRLIGTALADFVDPADRPAFSERLAEMRRGARERVSDWTLMLCPATGRRVSVNATVSSTRDDGAPDARTVRWQLRNDPQRELFESDLRGAVILAEERERSKLSQDLHDDLSQLLALVAMRLGRVRDQCEERLGAEVREIEQLVRQATQRTSSLTFQLHPPVLKSEGLVPAARWLAEDLRRRYGLHVKIETQGDVDTVAEPTRVVLFRSLRELLVNVAKHSETAEAHVTVSRRDDTVEVLVADRGVGFDANTATEGYGLRSIRERVQYLGGTLEIDTATQAGTRARIVVPDPV